MTFILNMNNKFWKQVHSTFDNSHRIFQLLMILHQASRMYWTECIDHSIFPVPITNNLKCSLMMVIVIIIIAATFDCGCIKCWKWGNFSLTDYQFITWYSHGMWNWRRIGRRRKSCFFIIWLLSFDFQHHKNALIWSIKPLNVSFLTVKSVCSRPMLSKIANNNSKNTDQNYKEKLNKTK